MTDERQANKSLRSRPGRGRQGRRSEEESAAMLAPDSCSSGAQDTLSATSPRGETQPWHRLPGESGIAHETFLLFRDLGPKRTVAAAAREAGKCASLLYRWVARHHWWERARAWDLAQERDREMSARRQREQVHERWLRNADRLERLAMAIIASMVRPDPDTGQPRLDPSVRSHDAMGMLKLSLQIHDRIAATAPEPLDEMALDKKMNRMSDVELEAAMETLDQAVAASRTEERKDER